MKPPILPVSNPSLKPPSSSSPDTPEVSTTAATMLLIPEDDLSATRLLISTQFEDEKAIEVEPFLSRASSYTSTNTATPTNFYQKRCRRTASDNSLSFLSGSGGGRGQSFREGVGHAASETYLMPSLGFNLLGYLGWVLLFLLKSGS